MEISMTQEPLLVEDVQLEQIINIHERECAIRYQMVNDKLDALDKRSWRLEAMIMVSTVSFIALAVVLLTK